MESVLSNTSKVLVDSSEKGGSNNLMYLPIDKLIDQNQNRRGNRADGEGRSPLSSLNNDSPRFADLPGDI